MRVGIWGLIGVLFGLSLAVASTAHVVEGALEPERLMHGLEEHKVLERLALERLPHTLEGQVSGGFARSGVPDVEARQATQEVVELFSDLVPPDVLTEHVVALISELEGWLRGESSELVLHVSLREHVEEAVAIVKRRIRKSPAFRAFYHWQVDVLAERFVERRPELPLGLDLSAERARRFILELLPSRWVARSTALQLDRIAPFFLGDADGFELFLPLHQRAEDAELLVIELLREADIPTFVLDHLVAPRVRERLPEQAELPYGIVVTRAEILAVLDEAVSMPWIRKREEEILDETVGYLTGRTDALVIRVPLKSQKSRLTRIVSQLIDRKLAELIAKLPPCKPVQLLSAVNSPDILLKCRPPGAKLGAAKRALGLKVSVHVEREVAARIPDSWTYTEAQMRERVGEQTWDIIQRLRKGFRDGITIRDDELGADFTSASRLTREGITLGPELEPHLVDARAALVWLPTLHWVGGLVALLLALVLVATRKAWVIGVVCGVLALSLVSLRYVALGALAEAIPEASPQGLSGALAHSVDMWVGEVVAIWTVVALMAMAWTFIRRG